VVAQIGEWPIPFHLLREATVLQGAVKLNFSRAGKIQGHNHPVEHSPGPPGPGLLLEARKLRKGKV